MKGAKIIATVTLATVLAKVPTHVKADEEKFSASLTILAEKSLSMDSRSPWKLERIGRLIQRSVSLLARAIYDGAFLIKINKSGDG